MSGIFLFEHAQENVSKIKFSGVLLRPFPSVLTSYDTNLSIRDEASQTPSSKPLC
jgi:hypothetical protein